MNADHYFVIGKPHITQGAPCEDYALSGELGPDVCYGVVSDGCGGAWADTDVGARALSHAYKKIISRRAGRTDGWVDPSFKDELLAQFIAHQITDCPDDNLATLNSVVASRTHAQVYCFGDGALLLKYKNGQRVFLEAEWWGNAPFYLAYLQNQALIERFLEPFSGGEKHPFLDKVLQPFCLKKTVFLEENGEYVLQDESCDWFDFDQVENGLVLDFYPEADGIEAIAVFTDGVAKIGELPIALREFTSFKNFRGGFVKRRVIKALEQFAKAGEYPRDDFAMACIWFGDA